MDYNQKRVKKFMQMFGQETPEKPVQLDEKTAKLRAALIWEEAIELITNGLGMSISLWDEQTHMEFFIGKKIREYGCISFEKESEVDLAEVADGVGDVMVVTVGTSIACGIDQEPVNEEILNSNDSKMWVREDLDKVPPNCMIEEVGDDLYRVKRGDGKVIKSPSYYPAQIVPLIEEQKNGGQGSEISPNTLKMLESSIMEFKKGNVSSPINE